MGLIGRRRAQVRALYRKGSHSFEILGEARPGEGWEWVVSRRAVCAGASLAGIGVVGEWVEDG